MARSLKTLGLAVSLAAVLSGAAVSSASATVQFHTELESTTVTASASTEQVLSFGPELTARCKKVSSDMTTESRTTPELKITPSYTECTGETGGGLKVSTHIDFNSCYYTLTAGELLEGEHAAIGQMQLGCNKEGDSVTITTTLFGGTQTCLHIPEQAPTNGSVDYTNEGAGAKRDIKITSTITGIAYQRTGICGTGEFDNGSIAGVLTAAGENGSGAARGIWVGTAIGELHSEVENSVLTATALGTQALTIGPEETFTCSKFQITAAVAPKTAAEIKAVPHYSECKVKFGSSTVVIHVDTNSCYYTFAIETELEAHHKYRGPVYIECTTPGDSITLTTTILGGTQTCLHIPEQTPTGSTFDYTNEGAGAKRDVRLTSTMTGIEYTRSGFCGSGTADNAELSGEATVTGENAVGEQKGIWIE
jgi:hypothetical protein